MMKKIMALLAMVSWMSHAQLVEHRVLNNSKNPIVVTFHTGVWNCYPERQGLGVTQPGETQITKIPAQCPAHKILVAESFQEFESQVLADGKTHVKILSGENLEVESELKLRKAQLLVGDDEYYLWLYDGKGAILPANKAAENLVQTGPDPLLWHIQEQKQSKN